MTDPSASPPPLPPDTVDELLSAELDGEFDAAASDLGFTPEDARTRLAATPNVDARRTALSHARDLLSQPDALDDVTAARLRTAAVAAGAPAKRERSYRSLSIAAGIAAVIVGVIALLSVVTTHSSETKASSGAADSAAVAAPATSGTQQALDNVSFGSYADAAALVTKLQQTPAQVFPKRESTAGAAPASQDAANAEKNSAYALNGTAAGACVVAGGPRADASGTATVAGKPVTVAIYPRAGGHTVVIRDGECREVTRGPIP